VLNLWPRPGKFLVGLCTFILHRRYTKLNSLPVFEGPLLALCERTFNLLILVRDEYYHPQFHGSFSIKSVLPALVPEMGYGDLEIQHGLIAAIDFGRMVAADTPTDERDRTREALLAYCQRDTEAMVRVFDFLRSVKP